jgi:hypothetical protein
MLADPAAEPVPGRAVRKDNEIGYRLRGTACIKEFDSIPERPLLHVLLEFPERLLKRRSL